MTSVARNWAGNLTFQPRHIGCPRNLEELVELVERSEHCRVLGTGHSFNAIADCDDTLISLHDMPTAVSIDSGRATITGMVRYGDLAIRLHQAGWAVENLGSLPHISVAGACATATHGSGDAHGVLTTAIASITFVDGTGRVVCFDRAHPDFAGAGVHLGALGVVSELVLELVPTFEVRQWVYEGVPFTEVAQHFDEITSSGYSVSLFTTWDPPVMRQVWVKERVDGDQPPAPGRRWGGSLADGPRNPVPGMPAQNCTPQQGQPGPWHERLPHFRLDFTPSAGEELQTEYFVPRPLALDAMKALARIGKRIASVVQISEIRTVKGDDFWLSPAYQRDSVALHFTWIADEAAVLPVVAEVEEVLRPFEPRPHWGKIFTMPAAELRARYPRFDDFVALTERYDPQRKFVNAFLAPLLLR
ncbi:MAG: FAD-binding protein [Acidothermus sp.]|nr:FAD-binding protein [Acidothermus sp.]